MSTFLITDQHSNHGYSRPDFHDNIKRKEPPHEYNIQLSKQAK